MGTTRPHHHPPCSAARPQFNSRTTAHPPWRLPAHLLARSASAMPRYSYAISPHDAFVVPDLSLPLSGSFAPAPARLPAIKVSPAGTDEPSTSGVSCLCWRRMPPATGSGPTTTGRRQITTHSFSPARHSFRARADVMLNSSRNCAMWRQRLGVALPAGRPFAAPNDTTTNAAACSDRSFTRRKGRMGEPAPLL